LTSILLGLVAIAVAFGAWLIASAVKARPEATSDTRTLQLLALFAPGLAAVSADPRALLVWQPLAKAARQLFPRDFEALDRASGAPFPFTIDRIQSAHAQWTADWLAWEHAHDGEFKLKGAAAEEELARLPDSRILRARVDLIEREKLETYQRRYQEYIQVAKALQALLQ
jgi:hypothetical protein